MFSRDLLFFFSSCFLFFWASSLIPLHIYSCLLHFFSRVYDLFLVACWCSGCSPRHLHSESYNGLEEQIENVRNSLFWSTSSGQDLLRSSSRVSSLTWQVFHFFSAHAQGSTPRFARPSEGWYAMFNFFFVFLRPLPALLLPTQWALTLFGSKIILIDCDVSRNSTIGAVKT